MSFTGVWKVEEVFQGIFKTVQRTFRGLLVHLGDSHGAFTVDFKAFHGISEDFIGTHWVWRGFAGSQT